MVLKEALRLFEAEEIIHSEARERLHDGGNDLAGLGLDAARRTK